MERSHRTHVDAGPVRNTSSNSKIRFCPKVHLKDSPFRVDAIGIFVRFMVEVCTNGSCGDTGSAGPGFRFHPPFVGPDLQSAFLLARIHKIDVDSLRSEAILVPDAFAFHLHDNLIQLFHKASQNGGSRIQQISIFQGLDPPYIGQFEPDLSAGAARWPGGFRRLPSNTVSLDAIPSFRAKAAIQRPPFPHMLPSFPSAL
jgi:hypothetical protein